MSNETLELLMRDGQTIRDHLVDLLDKLWEEGESFNAKRPFGNSGWEFEFYWPLIRAGLVEGKLDEDGYVLDVNGQDAYKLIVEAIGALRL